MTRRGSELVDETFSRVDVAVTVGLALGSAAVTLVAYYLAPVPVRAREAIWWRLVLGLVVFVAAFVHELGAILRHDQPTRRAVIALAVLLPLFVTTFAWIYLALSRSDHAAFGSPMTRTEALYFTVTVLSTVGFGDITPKTDPARLTTTFQMVCNLILLGVVVRLLFGAAARASIRRRGTTMSSDDRRQE